MEIVKIIESENVNIQLSWISIILVVILIICIIVFWKDYSSRKKQLSVCYVIMGISAILFSFFTESNLTNILASLYASCTFAILYSSIIEKTNDDTQQSIQKQIETMKSEFEKSQKAFKDEALLEIDKINKGFLYKHDEIFLPNEESEPNEDLFRQLVQGIKSSKTYIYEGEDAIKSSICIYCLRKSLSQRKERLKATFIFNICNKSEMTEDWARNFFTTLFLLNQLYKSDKCFGELTILLKKNKTHQFVNLMDNCLLFSPYPKTEGKRYPITFLYTPKENEQSFFTIFKTTMYSIINGSGCEKIQFSDSFDDLTKFNFGTCAKYFGNAINCFQKKNMRFSNEEISKYFSVLLKQRIESYKKYIERYEDK